MELNRYGVDPTQEDVPWNLYEPEIDQPEEETYELMEVSTNEIKLSTGHNSPMLQ